MNTFPRILEPDFTGAASKPKIRILFGARQTGKSTLLQRLTTQDVRIFNLQERRTRLELEKNPSVFTQILQADTRHPLSVFVDEIQKTPSLLDEVQYLYDRHPGRYSFILTGSSSRKLKTASANLLPGRAHVFHLGTVLESERVNNAAGHIFPLTAAKKFTPAFPASPLEDILIYGSLPGVLQEPPATRIRTLESYVELYLEEEIRREALVRNVGAFHGFLELAAMESGAAINLHNLSRQSGVPVATLRTYYQVLEDTFIGHRIPGFGATGRKRVLTTPRFFFFDNGVRNAAARVGFEKQLLKFQVGQLLENRIAQELILRCNYAGKAWKLSYWRTTQGAEVDFVLETPSEVIPIEVKATTSPHETDIQHIKLFLQTYPKRAKRGYLVCRVPEQRRLHEQITAIPWNML